MGYFDPSDSRVHCVTPSWGSYYPAATTRLLLLSSVGSQTSVHTRVAEAEYDYFFYQVWSNFSSLNMYGSRGGDIIDFSFFGASTLLFYLAEFTDSLNNTMTSNCSASDQLSVLCISPPWGVTLQAALSSVSIVSRTGDPISRILANRNLTSW
jgi:hypothetical protein